MLSAVETASSNLHATVAMFVKWRRKSDAPSKETTKT